MIITTKNMLRFNATSQNLTWFIIWVRHKGAVWWWRRRRQVYWGVQPRPCHVSQSHYNSIPTKTPTSPPNSTAKSLCFSHLLNLAPCAQTWRDTRHAVAPTTAEKGPKKSLLKTKKWLYFWERGVHNHGNACGISLAERHDAHLCRGDEGREGGGGGFWMNQSGTKYFKNMHISWWARIPDKVKAKARCARRDFSRYSDEDRLSWECLLSNSRSTVTMKWLQSRDLKNHVLIEESEKKEY